MNYNNISRHKLMVISKKKKKTQDIIGITNALKLLREIAHIY